MKWVIALLIAVTAGYMLFDGMHALTMGNYVTPSDGEYAGQLGPWAGLVSSVGIDPNSLFMQWVFVGYGVLTLAVLGGYITGQDWGRKALAAVAVLGLWYLPFGTALNILVLILLFIQRSESYSDHHG